MASGGGLMEASGLLNGSKTKGLGFLVAAYGVLEVYSGTNSSPWTMENFGANDEKADSARWYIRSAVVFSILAGAFGSLLDQNWWPLIGTLVANAYMYWLYERAIGKGKVSQSDGWSKN